MATSKSRRFDAKRDEIIASATSLLNERGVRGMTLADVFDDYARELPDAS